ncbi:hypothetical protein B0H14DRAFT_3471455 [Mycena olivaceomarginata]|nr:hypothetical protein B0H14DRAFT_3471455 [Mycena olivaceomarginata]
MEAPPPAPPPRSPLRPPPQPAPTSPSTLSKRQHALHELMSSERAYASDLTLILEVHIPLADGPMTADDVKIVFGNIGELAELSDVFCEALERTIGSALEDPDATDDHIGELFLRYAPELEGPYKQYITRHPSALAHLTALPQTPELTAYHQKTRDLAVSLSHAWDLQSLLIKPVQRLLKYSLLLTAIIDATALTHPDRPHLVNARTTMEEVARQVNEGRRRAEVVKEVLTAPKKPPTLLRIKSFRAPHRMAAELARIDVFAQQLARTAQEWARAADAAALALLAWANSFSAAIGLSSAVRSEAFDTFLATLTDSILPLSSGLLPAIAADLLAPLARLLASAAQPRQLLASMAEHAPLHHHLLTMPLSAKNRPPPALLSASAHYLALRTQLAAELPAYLALLHRGLSALVRRLAGLQAGFFGEARDAWAGLWDMLRVEGERNGGGEETVGVWRARWGDVDNGVAGLRIYRPLRGSSTLGPAAAQLTPAEAVARAYSEPAPINTHTNTALGYAIGGESSSPSSLAYANGGPPSPHYERNSRDRDYNQRGEYSYRDSSNSGGGNTRDYSTSRNNRDSSGASVHTNTSSTSSGKAAHVSNVLAALDPGLGGRRAPAHSNSMSSGYTSTSGGYGAASSSYATSMASGSPPPPTISGPFSLGSITGKPKGAGDGYSGTGASSSYAPSAYSYSPSAGAAPYSPGGERAGFAGWNENGSTGRGKSPARGAGANGSSGANGSGSGLSRSESRSGSAPVLANRNGNGASKFDLSKVDPNTFPIGDTGTVRRSHSPTPTTMTTRTVKDGQEEFGEVVAEIGWGDYGGSILPPKSEWMIFLVSDFFLSRSVAVLALFFFEREGGSVVSGMLERSFFQFSLSTVGGRVRVVSTTWDGLGLAVALLKAALLGVPAGVEVQAEQPPFNVSVWNLYVSDAMRRTGGRSRCSSCVRKLGVPPLRDLGLGPGDSTPDTPGTQYGYESEITEVSPRALPEVE